MTEEEKEKKRLYNKKYREANLEKIKAKKKEHYEKNKEKILLEAKKYNTLNQDKNKARKKKYYKDNKETINKNSKEYYENNKEKVIDKVKEYYEDNKEKIIKDKKKYYKLNKDKIREDKNKYYHNKIKKDPLLRMKRNIKSSIGNSLRREGFSKKSKTQIILDCSFDKFKLHLESKMEPWMSWDNYGLYNGELNHGWDIDHIIPLCSAKTEEELLKLNHHTNLQPLCSKVNRDIKKGKY